MANFDRFDICGAYNALENDWNVGGWLHERPSNQRRRESIGVQLSRIGYRPPMGHCGDFETLENDEQRAIYCEALARFGMAGYLRADDDTHAPIIAFLQREFTEDYLHACFPALAGATA